MRIIGRLKIKTYKKGTRKLLRKTKWIKNLVVLNETRGGNLIVRRLGNDITYDLVITKAKIGTGTAPPVNSDTDLQTPVATIPDVAQRTIYLDKVLLSFFISDANLPNGTYNEFGVFCADRLFARTLIVPAYVKGTGEDTNIDYEIKFFNE